MPDVTPMFKTGTYRRRPRTEDEFAVYMSNFASRLTFAGGRCELALSTCTEVATEPHHVFPQRLGRDDSFECLRASCKNCNARVETMGKQTAERLGLYSPVPLGPTPRDDAS